MSTSHRLPASRRDRHRDGWGTDRTQAADRQGFSEAQALVIFGDCAERVVGGTPLGNFPLSRSHPFKGTAHWGNKAFERQGDLPFLGLVFVLFHELHMVTIRVGAEADADRTFGKLEVHRSGNELNPFGL